MSELEPSANWYATKRHWTRKLEPEPYRAGRRGLSLCGSDVWDQEYHDVMARRYGSPQSVAKRVAGLPLCKRCERIAARLDSGSGTNTEEAMVSERKGQELAEGAQIVEPATTPPPPPPPAGGNRGYCPVCDRQFTVTVRGGMRWHNGDIYVNGWRRMCPGVGEPPKDES